MLKAIKKITCISRLCPPICTCMTKVISLTRLKAGDHYNLGVFIGQQDEDHLASFYTRRRMFICPRKKKSLMKNIQRLIHGKLWIRFYSLLEFMSDPSFK